MKKTGIPICMIILLQESGGSVAKGKEVYIHIPVVDCGCSDQAQLGVADPLPEGDGLRDLEGLHLGL